MPGYSTHINPDDDFSTDNEGEDAIAMTKPQTYQTSAGNDGPNPDQREHKHGGGPEPLSGSKKVKNQNHVSHNNPEGS